MASTNNSVVEPDPFDDPAAGDFIDWDECEGELLLFRVTDFDPDRPTKNSKPGKKSPCVIADVTRLTENGTADGFDPVTFDDVNIWSMTMVPALKPRMGRVVLAVLRKVDKSKVHGKGSSAWVLESATDEHKSVARRYLANLPKPKDPFDSPED